jgi:multiple sugar transport system substrate-binding protein
MSASERDPRLSPPRRLPRRTILQLGLGALVAMPLAAACGQASTPAPAKPAETAKPAEAAKPAAPAAAAPTAAPAAAAKPDAKPAEAAKPAAAAPAAGMAEPKAPVFQPAKITGKLAVVQSRDFHPDHNTFVEQKIREFAEKMNYPLDHSWAEAYAGAGNVVAKLTASVQAGDAPDVLIHTLQPSEMKFLELVEDTDDLAKRIIAEHGEMLPAVKTRHFLDGKYWAIPHFSRAGGMYIRESIFKAAGVDPTKDLDTWEKARDACLKAAQPEKEIYTWGITGNRSGDGETTVREPVMFSGGQLTDETGQIVLLNKEGYREGALLGLNFLKEVYTDPKYAKMLPPGVNAWTDPSNNEAFLAGKIAFTSNAGTMFAKAVFDKNFTVADDTIYLARPKGLGPKARALQGADAMRFYVMKGTKNKEAAEQLIHHLLAPDIQREIWKTSTGYAFPAHEWGWDDQFFKEDKYASKMVGPWKATAFDPSGFTGGSWPGPPNPWVASLESSNFWTDMFGEVLGGKSPEDALKSAHDKAVRVAKEFGFKGE